MNLSWLDDFLALAASGNFSRAAEERHMTQPAFSRRIRALEEWLGAELFDRSSQPAQADRGRANGSATAAHDLLARVARVPGEARGGGRGALDDAALRRHARPVVHLHAGLAARPRVAHRRSARSRWSPTCSRAARRMLLQSQVQFVLSHAHPQSSSELQSQDYPFVRVGTDVLMPVSAPDAEGRPRHR